MVWFYSVNHDGQVLLSSEDLKMMVEEASRTSCRCSSGGSHCTVDSQTFHSIMEHSTWWQHSWIALDLHWPHQPTLSFAKLDHCGSPVIGLDICMLDPMSDLDCAAMLVNFNLLASLGPSIISGICRLWWSTRIWCALIVNMSSGSASNLFNWLTLTQTKLRCGPGRSNLNGQYCSPPVSTVLVWLHCD